MNFFVFRSLTRLLMSVVVVVVVAVCSNQKFLVQVKSFHWQCDGEKLWRLKTKINFKPMGSYLDHSQNRESMNEYMNKHQFFSSISS
jgi:hypothetical protein